MSGRKALAAGLALSVFAPLLATSVDAAVVICQRKNKLKLRIDACTSKETQVDASELGVTGPAGPAGPAGPEGPSNLVGAVNINGDGTLLSSHAPGLTVATAAAGTGVYQITFTGTGAFAGTTAADYILQATSETFFWNVANAQVDSVTDDVLTMRIFNWESQTGGGGGDLNSQCFLTVYRGTPPPVL
jgi:hypothetical protein